MPFCPKCGKGIPVEGAFCPSCGVEIGARVKNAADIQNIANPPIAPAQYNDDGAERRQKLLDNFYLRLKWERKAWNISGLFYTISGAVIAGLSIIMFILGLVSVEDTFGVLLVYGLSYGFMGSVYLAIGIIGLIMKDKVGKYMDGLYYDCGPAVKRGESVGMIVFNAIFNVVALVFYIINYITVKEHREELEEIRMLQHNAYRNNIQ